MFLIIFGYIFHSSIGATINVFGGYESASAFVYGISIIPLGLIIGIIGFSVSAYLDYTKA